MKQLFIILSILFALHVSAQDKEAILKVLHTQEAAWNRADIPAFMDGYWKSDSLTFVGHNGPVYGWQTTLDNYKKTYPDKSAMGNLSFNIVKVDLLDKNNAFVLGGYKLKREKDMPGGYFTLWFRKIKGAWKIVCDHTS